MQNNIYDIGFNKLKRREALNYTVPFFLFIYQYSYIAKTNQYLFLPLVVEVKDSNLILARQYNNCNLVTLKVIERYINTDIADTLFNINKLKLDELKYAYQAYLIEFPFYRFIDICPISIREQLSNWYPDYIKTNKTIYNLLYYCICATLQTN